MDPAIGVYIIDRYTYYLLEFLEGIKSNSRKTMEHLVRDELSPFLYENYTCDLNLKISIDRITG